MLKTNCSCSEKPEINQFNQNNHTTQKLMICITLRTKEKEMQTLDCEPVTKNLIFAHYKRRSKISQHVHSVQIHRCGTQDGYLTNGKEYLSTSLLQKHSICFISMLAETSVKYALPHTISLHRLSRSREFRRDSKIGLILAFLKCIIGQNTSTSPAK